MGRRLWTLAGAFALATSIASPAWAAMVYVTNEKDNTITVVDAASMQVVADGAGSRV